MQTHNKEVNFLLLSKNCNIFTHYKKFFPLLLPSHNCIIITMFSFQGAFELLRNSMKYLFQGTSVNFLKVVEISGIEPLTSCLQGRRSPSWAKPPDLFWSGGPRTRFSAEKPRRLQHATGMLSRAAFRVHFGLLTNWCSFVLVLTSISLFFWSGGPKWTRTIDLTIISRVL